MYALMAQIRQLAEEEAIRKEGVRLAEAEFMSSLDWTDAQTDVYQARMLELESRLHGWLHKFD